MRGKIRYTCFDLIRIHSMQNIKQFLRLLQGNAFSHNKNILIRHPASIPQANPSQAKQQAKKLPKTVPQVKIGLKLASPSNDV